ncbi:MAG: hypothetical protein Q7T04_02030 [Dehalococcoidia bacterium]|nr:hypothetical protein [Dehalococcoidia bacterium]
MPKFIDHHGKNDRCKLTVETISREQQLLQQLRADIAARRADRFGVRPLNCYQSPTGESWCVTEAPSADAVIQSHEANGLKLARHDVVEVMPFV